MMGGALMIHQLATNRFISKAIKVQLLGHLTAIQSLCFNIMISLLLFSEKKTTNSLFE